MLSEEEIRRLEAFDGRGAQVLSAYLDLDPGRQIEHSHRVAFEDLIKAVRARLDEATREQLVSEATRVQAWLDDQKPRGKGLALFSCSSHGLWQPHFLPTRVDDHLAFEPKPDVAPLLDVLDEYERYAVALVDKENARLFTVFAGEIEESEEVADFVPGKHRQGGWAQSNFQRHHEAHVYWHLKRVARHLGELLRRRRFDRLILAGPEQATSELRRLLPRPLMHRLVAVILATMASEDSEILAKTLEVERRVEREVEERLLHDLLEAAGARGRAICGVPPTLDALWLGAVQTLVVADGVHRGGSECTNCRRLEPGDVATCPACGKPMRPVHDLFHRAVGQTLDQAGSVETVHGEPARRLLEAGGGLGAMLRFRPPPTPVPHAP